MISGNKTRALVDVKGAVLTALKAAFLGNLNWQAKSCERAIAEFEQICAPIAEVVLKDMRDCGDVPYVKGVPCSREIKKGVEMAREYFLQRNTAILEAKAEILLDDNNIEKWENGELGESEEHAVVSPRAIFGTKGQQSYYDKKIKLFSEAFTHNIKLLTGAWKASEQVYFGIKGRKYD